jgi:SAM-dependent methyltransferase
MSDQTGLDANDAYGGRRPTSHESRAGQPWDASYIGEPAPWDIGRPQPAILRLAREGAFAGRVLDAGCGTGENALELASLGLRVLGVDVAETAVSMAREKAQARGLDASFVVGDALNLGHLGERFDSVLDCGLFHSFDLDAERRAYAANLAVVTNPGARLFVLCFSDYSGAELSPHPITEGELQETFAPQCGWRVISIAPDRIEARFAVEGVPAWLATAERVG